MAGTLGIEPRLTESKSVVLPLHNVPIKLVDRKRIELLISGCKPDVLPLALTAQIGGSGWIRTNVLFREQIYSLSVSASHPHFQNCHALLPMRVLKHTQPSALDSLLLLGACFNALQYARIFCLT